MATQPKEPGTYNPWIDQRTGIGDRRKGIAESPLRAVLDEAIPGGASLAYVFGSGLLYLFLSQVVTGMFLALYYVPSADHAAALLLPAWAGADDCDSFSHRRIR